MRKKRENKKKKDTIFFMRKGISSKVFFRKRTYERFDEWSPLFIMNIAITVTITTIIIITIAIIIITNIVNTIKIYYYYYCYLSSALRRSRAQKKRRIRKTSRRFFVHLPRLWVALAFTMSSKEQKAIRGRTKV